MVASYHNVSTLGSQLKTKRVNVRVSDNRHKKLKAYVHKKEMTITQIIDLWIDSLPDAEKSTIHPDAQLERGASADFVK
jgi:ParG